MEPYSLFILNSILFGVGLAMDAFSVSMANGLREPDMKTGRMCIIAGTFAFFQILMPLLGWVCVHTIAEMFEGFQRLIPWIALLLLGYIGGKMLLEGLRGGESEPGAEAAAVGWSGLMLQGIATSIDALSVGFTIAEYSWQAALTEALIMHREILRDAACGEGVDPRRCDPDRDRTGDLPDRSFLTGCYGNSA